jgi:hypothetical protein
MLMNYLFENNWLMKDNAGKSLSIPIGNCGGKDNKNNVLRLARHMFEMGWFRECEFDFYIHGPTKTRATEPSIR